MSEPTGERTILLLRAKVRQLEEQMEGLLQANRTLIAPVQILDPATGYPVVEINCVEGRPMIGFRDVAGNVCTLLGITAATDTAPNHGFLCLTAEDSQARLHADPSGVHVDQGAVCVANLGAGPAGGALTVQDRTGQLLTHVVPDSITAPPVPPGVIKH